MTEREDYIVISKADIELLTDENQEAFKDLMTALGIAKGFDDKYVEPECQISIQQPLPEPTLMLAKDLPLGTRFAYQGRYKIFVLLENWGYGKCATEPDLRGKAVMQQVFHVANSEEEFDQLKVLVHTGI
jgi:hypothetical protein